MRLLIKALVSLRGLVRPIGAILLCLALRDAWPPARAVAANPPPPPAKQCYHLTKIETYADRTDDGAKPWLAGNTATRNADGSITTVAKVNEFGTQWRTTFQAWPKDGRAVYADPGTKTGKKRSIALTWTVPPTDWCSDQDVKFTLTAKPITAPVAGDEFFARVWIGAFPGETAVVSGWDKTIQGANPTSDEQGPRAGVELYHGANPTPDSVGSGSLVFRPTTAGQPFTIQVAFSGVGDQDVLWYHYEPGPAPGAAQTVEKPKCATTFVKDWGNSTWGKFVVRDATDGFVTGTYANRDGRFGAGTFTGTVAGDVLTASWRDASGQGTFTIHLTNGGCGFTGTATIKTSTAGPPGGTTTGGPTGTDPAHGGGGGSGPAGAGGGTALPAEPCLDANAQHCIDKWTDLAMSIRNKYDTSPPGPGGPWRVGKYGGLLGHGTTLIDQQTPDNWETVYHSSRYCYIWIVWQDEDVLPIYHGELPSLKSFVSKCYADSVTTGGTRTGDPPPPPPPPLPPEPPKSFDRMTLVAERRTVIAGDTVLVPVRLEKGVDVAACNFTVTYSAAVARFEGEATAGYLLDNALFVCNANQPGSAVLGFSRPTGVSGSGYVAYLPFRAVGKPGDRTPLKLTIKDLTNTGSTSPPIALVDGEIVITDKSGLVEGDCDGDGVLTTADAWCALQMSVGLMPKKANLDMDHSGDVTATDAKIILQRRVNR